MRFLPVILVGLTVLTAGFISVSILGVPKGLSAKSSTSGLCNGVDVFGSSNRFVEGRLMCATSYFSYRAIGKNLTARERRLYKNFLKTFSLSVDADGFRVRALLALTAKQFDKAIEYGEAARARKPNDPGALSDLAAAYLARGDSANSPADLLSALALSDSALSIEPKHPQAQFNLALSLSKLNLSHEAKEAWRAYLVLDPLSGWSNEARVKIRNGLRRSDQALWEKVKLQFDHLDPSNEEGAQFLRQVVRRYPQFIRIYSNGELMAKWARSARANREVEASRYLRLANAIGMQQSMAGHDEFFRESLNTANSLFKYDVSQRANIIEGHLTFLRALELYDSDRFQESRSCFEKAFYDFLPSRSPFRWLADFYLAVLDFYKPDYQGALRRLRQVHLGVGVRSYPYLKVRISSLEGLIYLIHGNPGESLNRYNLAMKEAHNLRDYSETAYVHFLMAEAYSGLGDEEEAWRHRVASLAAAQVYPDKRRTYSVMVTAAEAASDDITDKVALYFHDELIDFLRGWSRQPALIAEALLRRSKVYYKLGALGPGSRDLNEARDLLPAIHDPKFRVRVVADLLVADAERALAVGSQETASEAISDLTQAIAYFSATERFLDLPDLYRARARRKLERGQVREAESDLMSAVRYILRKVENLATLSTSRRYSAESIFDEMVSLQAFKLQDDGQAFGFAELGRAALTGIKVAPSLASGNLGKNLIDRTRAVLPSRTAVIEYKVLPEKLLIWVITKDRHYFIEKQISQGALGSMTLEFRQKLGQTTQSRAELYDVILGEPLKQMRDVGNIVFVCDKFLSLIPFSAIKDPGGHFLVESFTVSVVPSVQQYIESMSRIRQETYSYQDRILIIDNPKFDRLLLPSLPDLQQSRSETSRIYSLFRRSLLLRQESATKEKVLRSMRAYDIIHFSGHAVENLHYPFRSALVLATRPRVGGIMSESQLSAAEIANLSFSRCKLVVISGCSTASGSKSNLGSYGSLSSAFLMAGSPAVVGTLWDITDGSAASLTSEFYRILMSGSRVGPALRSTQLDFIHSADIERANPLVWGAFEEMGVDMTVN